MRLQRLHCTQRPLATRPRTPCCVRLAMLARSRSGRRTVAMAAEAQAPATDKAGEQQEAKKSEEYSAEMSQKMGASLTYTHELGMNFNRIWPDVIVGSCLQTPEDVDRLAEEEGVRTIFCLQEDSDMAYFSLDVGPIQKRCEERGDIKHVRFPVRDFDPYDLRRKLPKAVARLAREHDPMQGTVYIHCTAGLGRAPATAVAYMAWIRGVPIDEAMEKLTSIRRCSPKIEAIRSATADLLLGIGPVPATIGLYRFGTADKVQVSGLDVGWNQKLDLKYEPKQQRFVLQRPMFPGKYQFKFIIDDQWTYSADHQTVADGTHINNCLEVLSRMEEEGSEKLRRYMSAGCVLTDDEQNELQAMLCPWASHELVLNRSSGLQAVVDDALRRQQAAQEALGEAHDGEAHEKELP